MKKYMNFQFSCHHFYNRLIQCVLCHQYHLPYYQCRKIPCKNCYQYHNIKDLKDGLCPRVYGQYKIIKKLAALKCYFCDGEGTYSEQKRIIYSEADQSFQNRLLSIYQHPNQIQEGPTIKPIIFSTMQTVKIKKCKRCNGQGVVYKYKYCCKFGCRDCKFEGIIENDKWKRSKVRQKFKTYLNQAEELCKVCNLMVRLGDLHYKIQCNHKFHAQCLRISMVLNGSCPTCNRYDSIFSQELQRFQKYTQYESFMPVKLQEQVNYNN